MRIYYNIGFFQDDGDTVPSGMYSRHVQTADFVADSGACRFAQTEDVPQCRHR